MAMSLTMMKRIFPRIHSRAATGSLTRSSSASLLLPRALSTSQSLLYPPKKAAGATKSRTPPKATVSKAGKTLVASKKKTPAKKAAPKKSAPKKKAAPKKKKAPKKKAVVKRKKAVKAKPKPKKKKIVAKKPKKPSMKSLIKPPKQPQNVWQIFLADYLQDRKSSLATGEKLPLVSKLAEEAASQYRELPSSQREELQARADEQRRSYPDVYVQWLSTLTPDMIKEENVVRFRRRKAGLSARKNLRLAGEPKRPLSAYFRYIQAVRAGGVSPGLLSSEPDVVAQSKLIAQAWRGLSHADKQAYVDAELAAKAEYQEARKAFLASRSA